MSDFAFTSKKIAPQRAKPEDVASHLESKGYTVSPAKYGSLETPGKTEKRFDVSHPDHPGETARLAGYGGKYAHTSVGQHLTINLRDVGAYAAKKHDPDDDRSALVNKAHFDLADKFDTDRRDKGMRPDKTFVYKKNQYWNR